MILGSEGFCLGYTYEYYAVFCKRLEHVPIFKSKTKRKVQKSGRERTE